MILQQAWGDPYPTIDEAVADLEAIKNYIFSCSESKEIQMIQFSPVNQWLKIKQIYN